MIEAPFDSYSANRTSVDRPRSEGMERRLVERAMHGDEAAFDLRDPFLAEDATQRALLEAGSRAPADAFLAAAREREARRSRFAALAGRLVRGA